MSLALGIIFGILSMICFGMNSALAKIPAQKLGNVEAVFFRNIFSSLFLFIIFLIFLPQSNFSFNYILIALIVAVVGYIPIISLYQGIKKGKIGIVVPVAGSYVFFTVIFSVIFFGEFLTAMQVGAIALIIIGIILISVNLRDFRNSGLFKFSSGIPYALITCFFWGLYSFLFKIPVLVLGPILTSLVSEFGIMLLCGIHLKLAKIKIRIPDRNIAKYIILVAFFGASAAVTYGIGVQNADVSIVASIASANPLIAALYGRVVYKEKISFIQYLAMFVITLGIILITI